MINTRQVCKELWEQVHKTQNNTNLVIGLFSHSRSSSLASPNSLQPDLYLDLWKSHFDHLGCELHFTMDLKFARRSNNFCFTFTCPATFEHFSAFFNLRIYNFRPITMAWGCANLTCSYISWKVHLRLQHRIQGGFQFITSVFPLKHKSPVRSANSWTTSCSAVSQVLANLALWHIKLYIYTLFSSWVYKVISQKI